MRSAAGASRTSSSSNRRGRTHAPRRPPWDHPCPWPAGPFPLPPFFDHQFFLAMVHLLGAVRTGTRRGRRLSVARERRRAAADGAGPGSGRRKGSWSGRRAHRERGGVGGRGGVPRARGGRPAITAAGVWAKGAGRSASRRRLGWAGRVAGLERELTGPRLGLREDAPEQDVQPLGRERAE